MDVNLIAPRPRNAGLKVKLAQKLGIPIYSALEGVQAMMEAMRVSS